MQKKPTVKKEHFLKAKKELEEVTTAIAKATKRQKELRNIFADLFHDGEDGTKNVEAFGFEIKVVRNLNISCNKEAQEQFAEDNEELYQAIFPEKVVRVMDPTLAKKNLDEIEDYVTTKQGLPTVTFKAVE